MVFVPNNHSDRDMGDMISGYVHSMFGYRMAKTWPRTNGAKKC